MESNRFDDLLRSLANMSARRMVRRGFSAALLGFGAGRLPGVASAKKDKKSKKKPLKLNAFGCVNVGGACQGKDNVCCSGICDGEKPKKGKKDKSECIAHDTGTGCVTGLQAGFCGGTHEPCTTSTGGAGVCDTTTGNAPYCTDSGECFPCKEDKDCIPVCGPRAACAKCATGCASTGGTVCVGPTVGSCTLP